MHWQIFGRFFPAIYFLTLFKTTLKNKKWLKILKNANLGEISPEESWVV
jgi:hypothetical protein